MKEEEEVQSYRYQAPVLPAIVAAGLNYTFYWMVPFWIFEFIFFWMKDQMLENGVDGGDWAVLALWAVSQIISNNLAIRSIKHPECSLCSPIVFFIGTVISLFIQGRSTQIKAM